MIRVYEFERVSTLNKFIEDFFERHGECKVVQIQSVNVGQHSNMRHYLTIKLPNKGKK